MSIDDEVPAGFSLRRWSRRKLAAARVAPPAGALPAASAPVEPHPMPPAAATATGTAAGDAATPVASALPPPETLSFDSDFTAYLQPKVEEAVKRKALRALFRDPRFNVMDGLDVYIDDYSIPDPISAEMVRGLVQSRAIFDPPQTRINAAGHVEDVPADERVPRVAAGAVESPAAIAAMDAAPVPVLPATAADAAAPDALASDAASPDAHLTGAGVPDAAAPDARAPDARAPVHPETAPRSPR
jgi:hypothetical protein